MVYNTGCAFYASKLSINQNKNDNDNTMYKISRTPASDGFTYEEYTTGQGDNKVVTLP